MIDLEDATAHVAWIGSANYSEVDAVKTANAAKTNLEIGLTTLTQELGKKGITLDQHLLARVAEIQKIERIAEKYKIDPKLLMGSLSQIAEEEIEQPEEEDDGEETSGQTKPEESNGGQDDE